MRAENTPTPYKKVRPTVILAQKNFQEKGSIEGNAFVHQTLQWTKRF